jgi:hypothetical protein
VALAKSSHAVRFDEEIELVATLNVGAMWERLMGEFLAEWDRQRRAGRDGEDLDRALQEFMDALSDKPIADMARQSSTVAYNEGRDVAIRTAAERGLVSYVVRSEVLDQATCENCASLDGVVFEVGTPEYEMFQPPARCLGGDRCRGFYVPVPEGM